MTRFGLFLPQIRMSPATIEARVRTAEEAGFDSVWFMDHLVPPGRPEADSYEGWTLASFLAARTSVVRLGHLVLCDVFRHPAVLAKMAATLDILSGGRLDVGIGWGSWTPELETFGIGPVDARERSERLDETLTVLRLLWSGDRVSFSGRHVRLDGALMQPAPFQERIPVIVGGAGERLTMPIVARHADWWNCPSYAVDRLAELRPRAGRARVSVQHVVGLATSAREIPELEALAARRFAGWGGILLGTPDMVAASLATEAELGAELFVNAFVDFGRDETLRLFADEVIPRLR